MEDAKRFAGIVIIAVFIAVTVVRGQIPGSPAVSASCSKAQMTRLSIAGLILILSWLLLLQQYSHRLVMLL